jgi:hypothetical protein
MMSNNRRSALMGSAHLPYKQADYNSDSRKLSKKGANRPASNVVLDFFIWQ